MPVRVPHSARGTFPSALTGSKTNRSESWQTLSFRERPKDEPRHSQRAHAKKRDTDPESSHPCFMRIRHRHIVLLSSFAFVVGCVAPPAFSQSLAPTASTHADPPTGTKKTINTEADLPRFSYPLKTPPSEVFNADDATFNAFAQKVVEDLHRTLQDCEITDKATRRGLLEPLFYVALLTGQDDTARQLLPQLQANQDKEELRLTTWRIDTAYLQAAQAAGAKSGPRFIQDFGVADHALTDALPWDMVQETLRQQYGIRKVALANGTNVLTGLIKENIDPVYTKTGAVDH